MSEFDAATLRSKMKAKARAMGGGSDAGAIDASGWTPPAPMNADVKTGERPISRRQFASGGTVSAERADKLPRGIAKAEINRDVREANQDREGKKHVGGFANGGHVDKAADVKLIHQEFDRHKVRTGNKRSMGGIAEFVSPAYALAKGKVPGAIGLTVNKRKERASGGGVAAEWGERPKGGRTARKSGGKAVNVNITVESGKPPMPPPMPPIAAGPPPGPPPGLGAPMPMPPPGGPPPGAMPRKAGGRTYRSAKDMDAGALSGLGRLEKTEIQKHKR